jgi:hypothetical protein
MKRNLKRKLLSLLLIIFNLSVLAQNGSIQGVVIDKKSKESIIGATVKIEGTSTGAITDFDGKFAIKNLKPGKYWLKISYVSFGTFDAKDVVVEKNKATEIKVALEEKTQSLEGVTVYGQRKSNTDVSMINTIKSSTLVISGVSSQQIQKTQDKDASEVVKRIPGVTIIGDKFLIVRGLNQRYNTVWVNNSATPSSEADVRAFSFDVIPSQMIDNLMIYKTGAPELPADFAGGFVKIFTKNLPDSNFVNINYGVGFNTKASFKTFETYKSNKYDWLALDGGERSLSGNFPSHLNNTIYANGSNNIEGAVNLSKGMDQDWLPSETTAGLDQKVGFNFGRRFKIKDVTIGNLTSVNYGQSFSNYAITLAHFGVYDFENDKSNYSFNYDDNQSAKNVKISVLNNWSVIFKNGLKLEFRNFLNQISYNKSTLREGYDGYTSQYRKANENNYMARTTYSGQLGGEFAWDDNNSKIDWVLGYSYANRKEPDTKKVVQIKEDDPASPYYGQYKLDFSSTAQIGLLSRRYIDMQEYIGNSGLNWKSKLNLGNFAPDVFAGFYLEGKKRQFDARNFGYAMSNPQLFQRENLIYLPVSQIMQDANFNTTTGIRLDESTNASDSYTAYNYLTAAYFAADIPFTSSLNLHTGLRIEKNTQKLYSYKTGTPVASAGTRVKVIHDKIDFFPSANLSYSFNPKNLVRLAYSMTINRPEFRDIAPFYFVDFNYNAGFYGNPDLKDAKIHNFDLRYEMYPSTFETFSVGLFYKKFIDPIELLFLESVPLQYTFANAKSATSYGIEVDFKKNLGFMGLNNFSLVSNVSLIRSHVQFPKGSTEKDRALQGQSPYIINTGLFYDNKKKGWSVSLLYNVIGERITAVAQRMSSSTEDIPEILEMPRDLLDLSFTKKIGKGFEIKGGVKDLISLNVVYQQNIKTNADLASDGLGANDLDGNTNDKYFNRSQVTKKFNPGITFNLGVSYTF